MARLLEKYRAEIIPRLMQDGRFKNVMEIPKLEKIVINMGVGRAKENKTLLEHAMRDLALISGQKPIPTKARKSVSGFKLRKGQEIGCKVTLRGRRMYEFLDRLINIAIPRIRDFRGLSVRSFDEKGNFTLGIAEQLVFPEVSVDKVEFIQGMNITIAIRAKKREDSILLLKELGMPFR
jgi:large subunit ribosomal protein L5